MTLNSSPMDRTKCYKHETGSDSYCKPVRTLHCCVCGTDTKGRQWYNRDRGYGLCPSCGDKLAASEDLRRMAGIRGVHWDVQA